MSTEVETGTREDVERLIRELFGVEVIDGTDDGNWERIGRATVGDGTPLAATYPEGILLLGIEPPVTRWWNPFTDANADVQVLERVRETWDYGRLIDFDRALDQLWEPRPELTRVRYHTGDYARAALHVLNTEKP